MEKTKSKEEINRLRITKHCSEIDIEGHGYNIGAKCSEAAGQSVMHLRLHPIPRWGKPKD